MIYLIVGASAVALAVFVERVLHFHRAHINSMEFLNGVRNVLKRDNVVEALSICDATPGPVARLVKTAILNRERGREGVRESLEEAGLIEVPPLEDKLNLLATIAQIAPLMGLLARCSASFASSANCKPAAPSPICRCSPEEFGRDSFAPRRAWRWRFPAMPPIIIW